MSGEKQFLEWLAEQPGYYVRDDLVEEQFPDLEYQMIGVTKRENPETGEIETPKRDWRQAVKWGGVTD